MTVVFYYLLTRPLDLVGFFLHFKCIFFAVDSYTDTAERCDLRVADTETVWQMMATGRNMHLR